MVMSGWATAATNVSRYKKLLSLAAFEVSACSEGIEN